MRWVALLLAVFGASSAAAQTPPADSAVAVAGGMGLRGIGRAAACCGPFRTDLERPRSWWLAAAASRDVTPRLAVEVEVSWSREPRYVAYVQGAFRDLPVRGYRADNRVQTLAAAALLRWHAWRAARGSLGLVAGLGWAHERRESALESVVFRPPPLPVPTTRIDLADARNVAVVIVGVDGEAGGPRATVIGTVRVHRQGPGDAGRSDLDLGRTILRLGAGVRTRF